MINVTVCGNETPFCINHCIFGMGIGACSPKKYADDATDSPIRNIIFGLLESLFTVRYSDDNSNAHIVDAMFVTLVTEGLR